ncbi:MAG TPA: chemotaxis protein CheB, partial [Rubricoccaceae bacterium]
FVVVGLGASAGGLEALEAFFAGLPKVDSCAFVVVLHLAPDRQSELADILARSVPVPVVQVTERTEVEKGHVYVIPPNRNLVMEDGHLVLATLESERRKRRPVDFFFRSLAAAYGDHAVAVVLSGTGMDGSTGVRAIKEAGGLILVQDPEEAHYDEMPRSTIVAAAADLVAPAGALAAAAIAYSDRLRRVHLPTEEPGVLPHDEVRAVQRVLGQLRARTGHDFAHYKRSTVLRRLERRLHVVGVDTLDAYADHLNDHPDEARELLKDLLISVTNFFRNPETFAVFERDVVPHLFEGKGPTDTVRVWCAGCATGEEAYSIAILLAEHAATLADPPAVQVFATDLSERAIRTARDGVYPESIEADVTAERLQRFFRHEARGYRVVESLRERVVFAPHSLLRDPPFSHVDLIACRNLLIYFQRVLQQRALELFAYALEPGGYLFLGTSETTEVAGDAFHTVDKTHRLYRRREGEIPPAVAPIAARVRVQRRPPPVVIDEPAEPASATASYSALHRRLRAEAAPPSVLVNETNEVVHFAEGLGPFLQIAGGDPTRNVLRLVRSELRVAVQTALFQAQRERSPVASGPSRMDVDGVPHDVVLKVRPAPEPGLFQILFEATPAPPDVEPGRESALADIHLGALDAELRQVREQLQISIEEFETNREELQAQNEELQSTNEELRSTAEELETSKEEAQSMAEELMSVNDEMKVSVEELSRAKGDLENLIVSTEIATLFLDRQLHIKWFTPQARALFHVRASDIGRPLSDLAPRFGDVHLVPDAESVLDRLQVTEREVRTEDGRWFLAHVRPYRTLTDHIDGVVVTFVDITARRQAEVARRESEERYRTLFTSMNEGFALCELVLNSDGQPVDYRLLDVNPAYEAITGLTRAQAVGRTAREVAPGPEVEGFIESYARVVQDGEATRFESRLVVLGLWLDTYAFPVGAPETRQFGVVLTDITERKRAEEALQASAARSTFRAALADVLRPLDDPADVQAAASRLLGEHLGAHRLFNAEFEPSGHAVVRDDYTDGVPSFASRHHLSAFGPALIDRLRDGQMVVGPDVARELGLSRKERAAYAAAAIGAQIGVPLIRDGQLVSIFVVHQSEPREWTAEEVALVEETAERTWAAAERAHAETALRESEAKLRLLIESATDYAIYTIDPERRVTSWNAGAQALFGYAEDEILGQSSDILFTPEDRAAGAPEHEAAQALAEGRAPDNRWHLRKDGTRFYVNGVTTPLRDAAALGFVKIARDLTAQREAEAALHKSETQFRALTSATSDVIYRMSPDWTEMRHLAGGGFLADTEAPRRDWQEGYIHPDDRKTVDDAIAEAVRSKSVFELEHRVILQDGTVGWTFSRAVPMLDESGMITEWFGAASDVTERKRAEAEVHALNATLERRVAERTDEVRRLAARLTVAEQEERQRIAHVLHDDLQQQLYGLSVALSLLAREPLGDAARRSAEQAARIAGDVTEMARSLASELSPAILQAERLADVLDWTAKVEHAKYGLEVAVAVDGELRLADPALRVLL